MRKQHKNSKWASGIAVKLPPPGHSEFERYTRKLGLTEEDYARSNELPRTGIAAKCQMAFKRMEYVCRIRIVLIQCRTLRSRFPQNPQIFSF